VLAEGEPLVVYEKKIGGPVVIRKLANGTISVKGRTEEYLCPAPLKEWLPGEFKDLNYIFVY